VLGTPTAIAAAEAGGTLVADLRSLSIDELANIEVYSVSKSGEPLSQAPAAIYVITRDDIRRYGAKTIPEMLRLAPNLQVARDSALGYAISARGFNSSPPNKLLVLVDGRSVYTPLYSGVFWDSVNVLPEDIERIEVISGPGATLWGANAVNGVINIITRNSRDTQGALVTANGGNKDNGLAARFGGSIGDNLTYRIYAMNSQHGNTVTAEGIDANDGWSNLQGGFRVDWNRASNAVTFQGDIFDGKAGPSEVEVAGHNLLARWNHDFGGGSALQAQAYYDFTSRDSSLGLADEVEVFDVDLQHTFSLGDRHRIVWGGGYRIIMDEFTNAPTGAFLSPTSRTLDLGNLFIEDTVSITESVDLIAGLKLEMNSYTDLAAMPTVRATWSVTDTDLIWAAVSRAVRTPSRFDRDVYQAAGPILVIGGGPDFQDENLTAFELGYRGQFSARASLSVSAYYNDYDDVRTLELAPTGSIPVSTGGISGFLPATFQNMMEGSIYGLEVWGIYNLADWWRLSAGFNALEENLRLKAGSLDVSLYAQGASAAGNDPSYQFSMRSAMNLGQRWELDLGLRGVSALPNPEVPGYVELDARLGWRIWDNVELSIAGFNLLHDHHAEFGALPIRGELGRSFIVNAGWTF
jgi:iron complex outermembrane receptor protein